MHALQSQVQHTTVLTAPNSDVRSLIVAIATVLLCHKGVTWNYFKAFLVKEPSCCVFTKCDVNTISFNVLKETNQESIQDVKLCWSNVILIIIIIISESVSLHEHS